MSVKIDFNTQFIFEPLNASEIDLDFSFNNFSPNPSLVSQFVMQLVCSQSQDPIKYVNDWITQNSIIKNIPTNVILDDGFVISGQTKLSSSQSNFVFGQGQKTQYNVLFEPNMDSFFEKAKNLGFPSFLNSNDWVQTRYVTESNNKIEDIIFLSVFAQMSVQAAQLIYNIADSIKEAISTGFDTLSSILKFALKIAMNLIYLAAILFIYNELLKQVSETIFDKPKKMNCLDVWSTIRKGCEYLGYNFSSSLEKEYANLTILPATTTVGRVTGSALNNPNLSISLMDFIDRIGQMFNAKMKVYNGQITFENVLFFEQNPNNIQLLNLYNNGTETFNFEELPEKISIAYQKNVTDSNYLNNEYIEAYSPNFAEKELFGVENSIDVNLPFAIGQRKETQTTAEKIFNSLFDLIKGLSKSYQVKNGQRKGYLKLERDAVVVDTIFIRDNEKIANNSNLLLQSKTLFDNFYANEKPQNNQFVTVTGADKQPLCGVNTNSLLSNNVIKDAQARTIIVTSNVKNSRNGLYEVSYKRRLKPNDFGYFQESLIETKIKSVNNR